MKYLHFARVTHGAVLFAVATLATMAAAAQDLEELAAQVRATETAFAATMAARDHAAFVSFLDAEAVFCGRTSVLRGKEAVAAGWKPFFAAPAAPFSWAPEQVVVLDSGTLALSSGPVHNPDGRQSGTFNSVWRRTADGSWKIVFDKGCPPCEEAAKPKP